MLVGFINGDGARNPGQWVDEGGAGTVRGLVSNGHGALVHGSSPCQIVPNTLNDDGYRRDCGGFASRPSIFASPSKPGRAYSPLRSHPMLTDEQQQEQRQQRRPPKPVIGRKRVLLGANYQLADSVLPSPHSHDIPHNSRLALIASRHVHIHPNGYFNASAGTERVLCRWKPPPVGAGLPSMDEIQALLAQFDHKYEEQLLWAIYEGGWELSLTRTRFIRMLNSNKPLLDNDEMGDPIPQLEQFTAWDATIFEEAMRMNWKDFYRASIMVRKSTKSCVAFYYNTWKHDVAYKRVKSERVPSPTKMGYV